MSIDEKTIRQVAKLARLSLEEGEIPKLQKDLAEILDYAAKLSELATDGVKPTSHVHGDVNVFKEDVSHDSFEAKEIENIAPDFAGNSFRVPKVIG